MIIDPKPAQSEPKTLPDGLLTLLSEAEQFTFNLVKTQKKLIEDSKNANFFAS
jgi:hypothetical protein